MILLAAFLIVAALLAGFLALTAFEARGGKRLFAPLRARLDVYAGNAAHGVRRIDAGALGKRLQVIAAYIVHEIAHGVLIGVRALERLLTQTVRTLREHHRTPAAPKGETEG